MAFRLGELFCGPGGLAYGAQMASVEHNVEIYSVQHVWANDIDPDTCNTYRRNIEIDPEWVKCGHVADFLDLPDIPEIDAFAYGFPCNDFSVVGEQNGMNGRYGPLYTYGIRIINRFQPLWFFAENVGGLESANDGQAFGTIMHALRNAGPGYVITPHLYKFEDYGVPQCRHRIIIIGIRADLGLEFRVPAPTTAGNPKTAREAIEIPPIPEYAANQEPTRHTRDVIERLQHIPTGENAWYEGIPEHLRLNVQGARLSQIYKRLRADFPAYTITGSGGGGTHVYHWDEPRALTNRERARLQTFPDHFVFEGGKESVRKQIGMAVPSAGAKVIVEAVLKTFAGIEYEHVPSRWEDEGEFVGPREIALEEENNNENPEQLTLGM